jgi:hypothetical protein
MPQTREDRASRLQQPPRVAELQPLRRQSGGVDVDNVLAKKQRQIAGTLRRVMPEILAVATPRAG